MSSAPEDIRKQILVLVKEDYQTKFTPKIFNPDKDLIRDAGLTVKEFIELI